MKSARILVLALAILLLGLGLSVTPPNWGQEPKYKDGKATDYGPGGPNYYGKNGSWPPDPEMHPLVQQEAVAEQEVVEMIESYKRTENDVERSKIKSKLAALLEKEFDLQQKRRDLELGRAEARLKKVRELWKKRSDARQTIIDKRLDQLLREADGLGWTPPAGVNLRQNPPNQGFPVPLAK